MMLTQKEAGLLTDLQTQEQVCVDKYNRYSSQACDPGLKALFTDLHQHGHRAPHQGVVSPLFTQRGEEQQLVGAVVLMIDAHSFLFPMLQSWPVSSNSAETLLVQRDGEDVLFLNELRHRRDTALRLRIPVSRADLPAAMVISGRHGQVDGIDYRGTAVIAVGHPVPDSPWYMIAKIDSDEALAEWHTQAVFIACELPTTSATRLIVTRV